MPIALNEFMTGVENGQLKLEDGHSGNPVIVQANFSFADKVMQWLTQIPLLSDMKSVQAFVEKETQGNLRTLGVFLNALAHEYGDKFADNVASGLDMSGQTPLTARQIRDITQQAPHSEVTTQDVISQDEQVLEVPERTTHLVSQVMPDIKPAQLSQLEKASQVLSGCQSPMDLPTPTSLSMFNFFSYESVEMSEVQNQVKNYNQIVKDSSIMATANLLAQASNNHLSPEKVGEAIASLSDDIAAVKSGIESIEQASQAVPEAEQENLAALKRAMRSELSRLEKIETMTNQFSDAWDVESQSYKDVHDFYLSCSETLQASLTPELTLLCYEMIDNSPNHNRETLVNRLADKLVEYASDMASVNLRTLADALSEKVPQLANDVKTPFLQPEHKAQLGAINLINQALSQSKERLKLEQQGVEARLEIPQKLQALRHSAAIFTEQTQAYFRQETDLDMHFDATLLALTGQSFVAKGDELVADFEVELRELALEDSILEQLEDLDLDETSRMLAEDVLQTQHKMNWLDQENSYTKEVNNGVDVNLRRDVETRQLADNISQNSQRYGSYLGAKISATQDYIVALDALSKANISEGVTSQVNVVKGEAQGQLDRLSELESKRLVWQQAEDTKVLLNNKLARLDTMIGQTIDSDTKRLNLRGFLSYLKPIKANNDKACVLAVRQSELEAQLPRLEKALNDRFGSTWEQALNENQDNALVKDYQGLTTVIDQVKSQIKTLDKDYERSMLQLTQFDRQVMKDGGYPDVSGNSMEAWSAWMKQNVAGSWSEDHRPDISSLILERQMAKNGISGYAEAYQALYQTLSSHSEGLDSGDSAGVMKALGDLHNWAMAHPIESQALAGNLTHAYQIVAGNSGWFGADLATAAKTVWKTSTVENQVKDILQGRREFLPTEKSMTMSAEMIALLHLAQCAPYVAGAVKGAAGGGLVANAAGTLAGAVVPGGGYTSRRYGSDGWGVIANGFRASDL
ncbi:type III secretion system effector BopA family protein [Vibrio ostreicida]|uniref:type III secretion system effector BopA family protein n=1 Tax=Vibrio ostreicida TaxID=526588 RepID=UPI003B5926E5